ncbi:MAG: nitrite/sulfite reductase, partial [Giesbergeria sp.]
MYQYTDFDKQFVKLRAQQFRDQLERWERGELTDEQLLPLRLQNGWYIQRYAPMARIAVPYGEISSQQLRTLAHIAREYDKPAPELLAHAQATQDALQDAQPGATLPAPPLRYGYGHFTTRTNCQFNWIPLSRAADVMDLLASVGMHGIQTSGNDIRNITCDALEGIAADSIVDCRPFAEITRQWSSLHPEFSYLPRKFKIAFNGAAEDRAAIGWYDIGLQARLADDGSVGFTMKVGGGMGRTPVIGSVVREFLPWDQLLNYIEAVVRTYNSYGRRDNKWKARIKILVKSEGQKFIDAVEKEYKAIVELDGAPHTITQAELDRVSSHFVLPKLKPANLPAKVSPQGQLYQRWLQQNVRGHKLPGLKTVTLSFKRPGSNTGDA